MIATGFALIAGLLTLATPSARAQGTFPLQCRGGGQANMKYDSAERTIYARFRPAPGPAGNGLAPGHAAGSTEHSVQVSHGRSASATSLASTSSGVPRATRYSLQKPSGYTTCLTKISSPL